MLYRRSQLLAAFVLAVFAVSLLANAWPLRALAHVISYWRDSRPHSTTTTERERLQTNTDSPRSKERAQFTIYRNEEGEIVCRAATDDEVRQRAFDTEKIGRKAINHPELFSKSSQKLDASAGTGLTIILRATQQLQQNQAATAAFVRAAQNWETLVMSPITIYIDVDFGTTYFGQTWPSGVLGATSAPTQAYPYDSARTNLVAEANGEGNTTKQAIFNALPSTAVPTDLGGSSSTVVSDLTARAIGLLPATAGSNDPAARIGFNSNFTFDFDPSDGITAGQIDFDAVATHEIGHALGFHSAAGLNLPRPAVWDFYRFRTGTTTATFTTAQRILTIGGSPDPLQFFFVLGNTELGLSTGGPNGSTSNGGDGWQSSHWKHASGCTPYIGIMDPAIPSGCRRTINNNDLAALSFFGYNLTNNNAPPPPPAAPSPPTNDNFANAQELNGCAGSLAGSTFGATSEAGEPSHDPTDSSSLSPSHTVWYQWQASATISTTITTTGSDFDTILAVYTGNNIGSLTRVAFNDDAQSDVLTSSVTFNATAGTTYQIAIDGWGGDAGTVELNWIGCPCNSALVVNDNGDDSDAFLGDGVCATTGGVCTLRAAIQEANSRSFCGTIDIAFGGVTGAIVLNTALPDINHNVNINGPGANQLTVMRSSVAGTPNFRIFTILTNRSVNISGLTLSNGVSNGAPLNSGGGLANSGTTTLTNSVVTGNSGNINGGGGLFNNGTLVVRDSLVTGNSTTQFGGGIYSIAGTFSVINSTISGNSAETDGGGIFSANEGMKLTGVTISNNRCDSDNNGSGGGGGLDTLGGGATLANTIIAGNFKGTGTTSNQFDGGGGFGGTIVSSSSYNLIGVGGSSGLTNGVNNNQVGVANPGLGPLANNGGPTMTHALLGGSPALDAGNNALAVDQNGNPLISDQRGLGFDRIIKTTVDIGAFEAPADLPRPSPTPTPTPTPTPAPTPTPGPCPATLVVNNAGDANDLTPGDGACFTIVGACTLRAAIQEANSRSACGLIDINFSAVSNPINLNSALPSINHNVRINGPGVTALTVQRNTAAGTPDFPIFGVENSVTISGLTISNGSSSSQNGTGVSVGNGTLSLTDSVVKGNGLTGSTGPAVQLVGLGGAGTLILANTLVADNIGTGVSNGGGQLFITNSTISNNTGFGVAVGAGSLSMTTSTVSGNNGGGLFNNGGATVVDSTISNNSAPGFGGGVYDLGPITLTNCTVFGNTAGTSAGGIYGNTNKLPPTINLRNTIVANNTTSTGSSPDLGGTGFVSVEYCLIGNGSGASFSGSHNITNVNPMVGPLASNGGATMTHPLLTGSPAINAGSNALAVDQNGNSLTTDQRGAGFSRIMNGTVDIGAFELGVAPVLLTDATNHVTAIDSVTFVRDPFSVVGLHNFSSDQRTRVMIFTSNLGLMQPSADLSVTAGGIPLTVEAVGTLSGVPDVSYIIVKLDPMLVGDVQLTVAFHGVMTNAGIISISP